MRPSKLKKIEDRVISVTSNFIIENEIDVPCASLTDKTDLKNDLGLMSLDAIDLSLSIEKEFDIIIPDSAFETMKTLSDICIHILEHEYTSTK